MLDPDVLTALLFEHIIMKAEQSLAATVAGRPHVDADHRTLEAEIADLHDRRRIAQEEMMRLPFRAAER